ncbi:MAG: hypothetical protein EZS28_046391, partial [Streblomastix strix]
MQKDDDAKKMQDCLCGWQKESKGKLRKKKFWEELKVEIRDRIVRERSIEEIIHFNPSYMLPGAGNKWHKILDCRSLTDNQTKGLRYSTGSGEGLSSLESERGLTEIDEIQVQWESLPLYWLTFWLEPESIAILQSNEINNQSNQVEVQRESGTIHGRPTDLIIGQETAGIRYGFDNLINERVGLEDVVSQMQGNTYEGHSIPQLEVKDLFDGKIKTASWRVVLSEIADNRYVSTYGIDQSSKNRSVEETKVEWYMEIRQKNVGGFKIVGRDDQGEQSRDVRFQNTHILSINGCGDNSMESGIGGNGGDGGIGGESLGVEWDLELEVFKLTRNSSSANGTKISEKQLFEKDAMIGNTDNMVT